MEDISRSSGAKYECLLFDMDDTLYPLSLGMNFACRKNIEEYMLRYLNIEESEVPSMCLDLYKEYGTTMAGLKAQVFVLKMEDISRSSGAKYECLLFDMDDTLYPLSLGMNFACRKNIEEYMLRYLNIEESEVPSMCLDLYKEYGTTMAGLKAHGYEFDNDEFHAYVHGRLPYELLKPDPVLRNLLLSMPQQKIIFTNADEAHVVKVLSRLGLEDCFQGVICFETLNPTVEPGKSISGVHEVKPQDTVEANMNEDLSFKPKILCKPLVEAMEAAIRIADVDPNKMIFFDDSVRNIANGKVAGLHTVIVGRSTLVEGADHALSSIHNIREAIPEIWEDEGDYSDQIIQPAAVETVVLA